MLRLSWRNLLIAICLLILGGCTGLPEISRQPTVFNPFPQLTKIAVVPFFNLSAEPSVDGRQFAAAYAAELQVVPGFDVVPIGVVETKLQQHRIHFTNKNEAEVARTLAQLLEVDAVVFGGVTDFTPYYPPRVGISVQWYAANPGFHPIPAGYGLPWGTAGEEEIPDALIFEAERALAVEQLKTQTPPYEQPALLPPPEPEPPPDPNSEDPNREDRPRELESRRRKSDVRLVGHEAAMRNTAAKKNSQPPAAGEQVLAGNGEIDAEIDAEAATALPPDWPDPRGFTPPTPSSCRPPLRESHLPVMSHVRLYHGTDAQVTTALQSYVYFRDEARFGGWQSYLQRSDDFIRFCCHMHIAEMLTARGGAGQTRVVWRWPTGR
jgi:hypothetical protein